MVNILLQICICMAIYSIVCLILVQFTHFGYLASKSLDQKQIETQVMKKYLRESWARENQSMHLDDDCFSFYEDLSNLQSENARGTLFQQCKKPASFSVIKKASIQSSILSVD